MEKPFPNPSEENRSKAEKGISKERLAGFALGAATFFLPLILYLRTLCPTIYPGDGAELTAAAWCLGVSHPTGYPLFMILGHLVQRLGLGSPAFSMNLMCAFFGALACLGAYRLQREIFRHVLGVRGARAIPARFAAAATALTLGVGATWWSHGTMTEVYSMMAALIAWTWATGLRVVRRPTRRGLWSLALISGVGFLHHQLFLVTLPLSSMALLKCVQQNREIHKSIPAVESTRNPIHHATNESPSLPPTGKSTHLNSSFILHPSSFSVAFLLFLLPLSLYLYLPMRAATLPPINCGDPQGLTGIIDHLTGKQFRQTRVLTYYTGAKMPPEEIAPHIRRRLVGLHSEDSLYKSSVLRWLGEQYIVPTALKNRTAQEAKEAEDPAETRQRQAVAEARAPLLAIILLLLALMGAVALWRSSPLSVLGLAAGGGLNLVVVAVYTIADIEAYQLPLALLVVTLAAAGPLGIAEVLSPSGASPELAAERRRKRAWITGVAILLLGGLGITNYYPPERGVNKSQTRGAHDYARQLMEFLPPDSVVFTTSDYDIYPLWYAQVCESLRPDVAVVGANFIFSRWYAAMLRANLPEGVEIYIGDRDGPIASGEQWLTALQGGMIAPQILAGRPVYITLLQHHGNSDLALLNSGDFRLEPLLQFHSMTPDPRDPPFVLYKILDPDNSASLAVETFQKSGIFPDHEAMMVRRERNE